MLRHLVDLGRRQAGAEGTDFLHMSQDPPGASGGVREAHECQTFHSSELASWPLPEGKMQESTLALVWHRSGLDPSFAACRLCVLQPVT